MTRANVVAVALVLGVGVLAGVAAAQATSDAGDMKRGAQLFAEKQCSRCHRPSGQVSIGPSLETLRRPQGTFELAGRLWNHAPAMFTALSKEGVPWPAISRAEMVDLMAYLDADPRRERAPDLVRGQTEIVHKGCLKCHSLNGEGGRVGPELAAPRPAYESAAAWASSMWTHTPRMAVLALERGVMYPRFTGDEMGNLVGFLRSVAAPR